MYFEDLTPYAYFPPRPGDAPAWNVGWLERRHRFPRGAPSEELLDRLFAACATTVARTRGFHLCSLCPAPPGPFPTALVVSRGGVERHVGSAEIRVEGRDGRVYAAPDLIYHYVAEHRYRPPDAFVAALLGR